MTNSPLEFLARQYDNVVKYDKEGNPSIFVRFPKMKSSDLDASLPEHTHPAFIVNGVEQDEILIGKFKACELVTNGTLYSLPNMPPRYSLGADQFLQRMRDFGDGVSGMTIADGGFLLLLAQKNGWDPKGNTDWGHSFRDATRYDYGRSVVKGDKRGFNGWLYECLQAHTTSKELRPDKNPLYWKKLKFIGGVEAYPGLIGDANYPVSTTLTLNGSGPNDWYLDGTPASVCDIAGNQLENEYGYRIVKGELQIMKDNNAADPNADLSVNGPWRAILPNKEDDGYTLVEPGTTGTLHWTWANSKITLDTVEPTFDNEYRGTNFKDLAVNSANLPHVPHIVKELGLFPTQGSTMRGYYYIHFTADERFPRRGGYCGDGGHAGLGYVLALSPRGAAHWSYGGRPRSL